MTVLLGIVGAIALAVVVCAAGTALALHVRRRRRVGARSAVQISLPESRVGPSAASFGTVAHATGSASAMPEEVENSQGRAVDPDASRNAAAADAASVAAETCHSLVDNSDDVTQPRPVRNGEAGATPCAGPGMPVPNAGPDLPVAGPSRTPESDHAPPADPQLLSGSPNRAATESGGHEEAEPHSPPAELPADSVITQSVGGKSHAGRADDTSEHSGNGSATARAKPAEADDEAPATQVRPPRTPRQFRPSPRGIRPSRDADPAAPAAPSSERALPIFVRLIFEKGGYCRLSLLARRSPAHPSEIAISDSADPPPLVALQDNWFQDVVPGDPGPLLREGIEWSATLRDGEEVRWSLSGRPLYVLAPHDELAGFVSTTRLVIGEQHIVLCTADRLAQVSDAITRAGSKPPQLLDSGKGIPPGWKALRGVGPTTAVPSSAGGDILDALCPLADIEIKLDGGIRVDRQAWLAGYPPRIRLRGDLRAAGRVWIDGLEASINATGGYEAAGWDRVGEHMVSCDSGSRSYAIREGAEEWQGWDAYAWSLGDANGDMQPDRSAICGAAVRPPPSAMRLRSFAVPASNTVLLGCVPGEIAACAVRRELRASQCTGYAPFDAVWAIPADPWRTDKRTTRVLLIDEAREPAKQNPVDRTQLASRAAKEQQRRIEAWRNAILAAGRKGLATEPHSDEVAALWRRYRIAARALRQRR